MNIGYLEYNTLLLFIFFGIILYNDLRYQRIPDFCLYGIVLLFLHSEIHRGKFDGYAFFNAFLLGLGSFALKKILERQLHRPALGRGDIKLMMVLGLWLPLSCVGSFLLFTGVWGCLWGVFYKIVFKETIFPFAPSIILGFLSVLICCEHAL